MVFYKRKIVRNVSFDDLTCVDSFSFGRDYYSEGNRRIQWINLELDNENDKILLLSRQIIYIDVFNDRPDNYEWASSYVRKFFNTEFIRMCFKENESKGIMLTDVHNSSANRWGISGGADTKDYVFLLSLDEFKDYDGIIPGNLSIPLHLMNGTGKNDYFIPDSEQQKQRRLYFESIDYDSFKEAGVAEDEYPVTSISSFYSNIGWWLRTPGTDRGEYMFVDRFGRVNEAGIHGFFGVQGYRPAMWVRKNVLLRYGDVG